MSELLLINKSTLTEIADAVRNKEGSTDPIPVDNIANRVRQLSGGTSGLGEYIPAIDDIIRMDNGLYCTLACYDHSESQYFPCTSEDGINWEIHLEKSFHTDNNLEKCKVRKVGDVLYVVGINNSDYEREMYGTKDGINYTRISYSDGTWLRDANIDHMFVFNNSVYITLVGLAADYIHVSTDGFNWIDIGYGEIYHNSFRVENGCLTARDAIDRCIYSFNGIDFNIFGDGIYPCCDYYYYYDGVFIGTSYTGLIYTTSDNGNTFTEVDLANLYFQGKKDFEIITATDNNPWMAKTPDGELRCYSLDGFNWYEF